MKNSTKGIAAFIVTQVTIIILINYLVGKITQPFNLSPDIRETSSYLIINTLLFLNIYFGFGFLSGKVFKLKTRNSIISAAISGSVLLTALWIYYAILGGRHNMIQFYTFLNPSALWALYSTNIFSDTSSINLVYTILPPVVFAAGIWRNSRVPQKNNA